MGLQVSFVFSPNLIIVLPCDHKGKSLHLPGPQFPHITRNSTQLVKCLEICGLKRSSINLLLLLVFPCNLPPNPLKFSNYWESDLYPWKLKFFSWGWQGISVPVVRANVFSCADKQWKLGEERKKTTILWLSHWSGTQETWVHSSDLT